MKKSAIAGALWGFAGVAAVLMGAWAARIQQPVLHGQDLSTDLANFLAAVHPRVTTTVDGATTFAVTGRFGWHYVNLLCTGAESIDTITGGTTGAVLYLANQDTDCTVNDDDAATAANAIDLTGVATTDVGAAKKMLILIYNGTDWEQIAESDN